jgi:hypothetical protein
MKWSHLILFVLKVFFLLQFILIILGKYTLDKRVYLATEIIFKLFLAIYIQQLLVFSLIKDISVEDKVIIGFASGLLIYDAIFNDTRDLLHESSIKLPTTVLSPAL